MPSPSTWIRRATQTASSAWLVTRPAARRYELGAVLGRGGFATVVRATDRRTGREVALKAVRPEDATSLRQEARALASVRHRGVVRPLDAGRLPDGSWFLTTELVDGPNLSELVRACGPLPAPRGANLLRQVARALAAVHEAGFVHGDLKPANALVERSWHEPDRVRLVDFGLAERLDGARPAAHAGGTKGFLAPELAGGGPRSRATDVYALGATALWLFSGRILRDERDAASAARALAHLEVRLFDLVLRCLDPDPTRRPRGAGEITSLLDELEGPRWTAAEARSFWLRHGDDVPRALDEGRHVATPGARRERAALLPPAPSADETSMPLALLRRVE